MTDRRDDSGSEEADKFVVAVKGEEGERVLSSDEDSSVVLFESARWR